MDDDGDGGASPDHYGGGGGGGGTIRLVCENCNAEELYSLDEYGDEGSFWCSQCDMEHKSTQPPPAVDHDFQVKRPRYRLPKPKPHKHLIPNRTQRAPAAPAFDEPDEPRDFVPGAADASWGNEPEELGTRVRQRYVRGLQVILQQQLEALVERHRVGALVCGVAGPLWLRWVAASKVFDEMWARKVLAEDDAAQRWKRSDGGIAALVQLLPLKDQQRKPQQVKCEWADEAFPPRKDRRRVEFAFLRSLRTMLPVYSTLTVCFLACHVAREAILSTDIYRWAMEGKLPYVAAFTQVDNLLGTPLKHCPLNARQLFRPVRVIGAWQLEAAAGSIARRIGLRLPSVNFYAIAHRYLNELSLPIERILPHACRIYEWAMPAQLWLSSNPARVPTRVCVMAILIVALRVQYNINGQGIWEKISEAGRNASESGPDANLPSSMKSDDGASEEFGTKELLCTLADAYDRIDVAHDYSKNPHSYLKYCENVVFPGIRCSLEDKDLIKIFQDMYKGREDKNPKAQMEETRATDGANKRVWDGTSVGARCFHASSSGIRSVKSEMEDHGFCYMPPRKRPRSDGYLHYRRKTLTARLACVGHADYYMLIRSFAKLAEVDVRIMHASVLKLERRLAWIEERIGRSLDVLHNLLLRSADGTMA